MRKITSLILCAVLFFTSAGCVSDSEQTERESTVRETLNYAENLKGVWFSYYEIGKIFASLSKEEAEQKAEEIFADLAGKGINTVFFHVRAFADAFYPSKLFPRSEYAPKSFDLLKLIIEAAHAQQISLHAWINPYRVANDKELSDLPDTSPAVELYKKSRQNLFFHKGGIYMNPARKGVQKLILGGIRELVESYDIDGIHFDDYFYPSSSKELDKKSYAAYKSGGGTLSREDYRRENVSALIRAAHALIKEHNESILFGVSPQCSLEKNEEELFADLTRWVEDEAVDYLMPQIYFGFENEASPFQKSVDEWRERMQGKSAALYCGLALYKSGKEDAYASENHKSETSPYYEWVHHTDIIARQIQYLKEKGVRGYTIYSYTSLVNSENNANLQEEIDNLLPVLNARQLLLWKIDKK